MAEKKVDPHATPVNNKTPFIAGGMILFAVVWLMYSANLGGIFRGDTDEEKKEKAYQAKEAVDKKKREAREAAKDAARVH